MAKSDKSERNAPEGKVRRRDSAGADTAAAKAAEAFKVGAAFKAFVGARGIVLGTEQAPKTKNSLDFFSATLRS